MLEEQTSFSPNSFGEPNQPRPKGNRIAQFVFICCTLFCIVFGLITFLKMQDSPPNDFPLDQAITIEIGTNVRAITEQLEAAHVVRSGALLYYTIVLFHDPATVKASSYIFTEPLTTAAVAKRLTEGDFDTDLVRLTHIEGERVTAIAMRAAEVLPAFDTDRFIATATPHEGRLFPDTYFVPATYSDEDLLHLMLETFEAKLEPLQSLIASSSLSLDETIILASIIEREANTTESKKMVSSVLQNRLAIGMALQADASIEYILNKPLAELTPEDLEIDSPYNTYLYPGLPPTPIGNPGLEAINAVLEPTQSDYFYYITDDEGVFHYAKTYDEHLRNIERYLR
ncbi:MAG: endolytic transglycosylase MltG [Candidatus Pacebacteria bacterium]|nr:endolytic transglycosylase MltG [Candidatus Paceibacterota bacterium]